MLATLVAEPFHKPGWVYEEKYDGYRILAYKEGKKVTLYSRNAKDRTQTFEDVACANTGGGDRADSTAGGFFPTGTLPLGAGGYLQYRPNVVATGDAWNRESNYETRPCADFGSGNQGLWRLKLKRDNTHFVVLPVFTVDTTPPDTSVSG